MESIVINVPPYIADAYKNADEDKRRNAEIYINTFLDELFSDEPANERLFKTMKKATTEAKANGFTPDMMDEFLKDDE
ncbi:MAG TPA: hypothetical protein VIJ92_01175 [Ginsengibacter sp.]